MNESARQLSESPQARIAAILDNHHPRSVLAVSQNPVPVLEEWCADHDCILTTIMDTDPLSRMRELGRFDLAVVADQLEYMNHHLGEELIGRLRNLHTESLVVLYQSELAPARLRWHHNDFLGMGMRRDSTFVSDEGRGMVLYTYELATYNFARKWNNPRFWANPENWGKYWW